MDVDKLPPVFVDFKKIKYVINDVVTNNKITR